MKFLKPIFPIITLLATVGCQEDTFAPVSPVVDESSNTLTINMTLDVADIKGISTRSFSDKPDYTNLKLYVLEFEKTGTGDPMTNQNSADYTATVKQELNSSDRDDTHVHFQVTLNKYDTPDPRILHFIAVPAGTELSYQVGGYEDPMITQMYVGDQTPAYWQRVEFPNGYGYYDADGRWHDADYLNTKFDHIPMLCNFAKVSMEVDANAGFILDGFALINQPTMGTVAPWKRSDYTFPQFLNDEGSIRSYKDIDAQYNGYWPFNAVNDIIGKDAVVAEYSKEPKFMYEKPRPESALYNPMVIMRGQLVENGPMYYYKLDLGYADESTDNLFQYYDILRNFEYKINVTNVIATGYSSAQDAMDGVVYNNFAFDVHTESMLQVTNGEQGLRVNQTTFVVTREEDREVALLYRFRPNVGQNVSDNNRIEYKVDAGTAIESVTRGNTDDDGWRSITIHTAEPGVTSKRGEIVLYDPQSGLGRTITIIVRNPWTYSDINVWGGNYNDEEQFDATDDNGVLYRQGWENHVSNSSELGQPLTVRFQIENNIDESMFPLKFTFEASRQNIENNKIGNQLVSTGETFFDGNTTTIKYTKTVTWLDYNTELSTSNPTGTIAVDSRGNTYHEVRARFQTITPIVEGEQTVIRFYNLYTRTSTGDMYGEVTFTGVEGTAPDFTLEDGTTPSNASQVTHPD